MIGQQSLLNHRAGCAFEWQQPSQDTKVTAAAAFSTGLFAWSKMQHLETLNVFLQNLKRSRCHQTPNFGRWFRNQVQLVSRMIHGGLLLGTAATPIFLHHDEGWMRGTAGLYCHSERFVLLQRALVRLLSSADRTSHNWSHLDLCYMTAR